MRFLFAPFEQIEAENIRQHGDRVVEETHFGVAVHQAGGFDDCTVCGLEISLRLDRSDRTDRTYDFGARWLTEV